ncbi:Aureobasidin resistance protein Aur1 [Coccidioides posadasii str. Silveira]|uniref:Aureobasidin-resistance protein n=3 Tax=Coccidioides posadasii TaxID=199306 RepID=E9CZP6_COCPS|nr:aureobasidin-resistance protein, putative [Coccidioides posadasii C735 delta SOWgp]EER26235.1 aureobasidin-resistance protein, putative [Coccidioides posadasii C735 delta SOWgp]EFW20149.1 aureobasidin-resistance protein [Coccidioides posadasii str. Silveira]KMM73286.1 aureobasidin-resistance protein [Coccidioides posadasii RMSCC 3488]QVM08734.1 Aureobasidin resistance protein Aur1 [Coccidioides posadasii str. Silveira]|eukprot:XP_003068380.1 aureobasidin-resistance protein, putative [Coccidioides posadasii C735 delta SOWgp]
MAGVINTSMASWKDHPQKYLGKVSVMLPWRSLQLLFPHRVRRRLRSKLRSRVSPSSSIASLKTSFSPLDTLKSLQSHRWTVYDGQYLFLAILGIFCLSVIETPGPLIKTLISLVILISLILPVTCQFLLPALPIIGWLVFWYAMQYIPSNWRPPIWVRVLPALENIFYGANLSNILSTHKNVVLDIMAWLPYGIMHFGAPAVCSLILFIFGPPGLTPIFARSFGYMNVIGCVIQFLFPCSPPWYENLYGLAPAHYGMPGSPAGLARIDELFGLDLYTSGFTASPVPFGAFPSLHAANATIEALFMSHLFPRFRAAFVLYTLWIWWATMYLSHHYAVDLVGGSLLAAVTFYYAKARFVPRMQHDKPFRWDYDYVEVGDSTDNYNYDLATLHGEFQTDSDEWTVGSSSSISSGSLSPVDEAQSIWDGDTVGGNSDLEAAR